MMPSVAGSRAMYHAEMPANGNGHTLLKKKRAAFFDHRHLSYRMNQPFRFLDTLSPTPMLAAC